MAKESVSKELMGLIKLVSFFKQLRHKHDLEKTGFVFVNELYNILPYRQCIFWTYDNKKVRIVTGSGQVDVGGQSPLAQFLKKAVKALVKSKVKTDDDLIEHIEANSYADIHTVNKSDLSNFSSDVLKEWLSPNAFCVFLYDSKSLIGGVWIDRDAGIGDMERAVLDDACDALAARIQFFKKNSAGPFVNILKAGKARLVILLCMLALCFWPVRFSVTANAEIIPKEVFVVSVPFNALIANVAVRPNQVVKAGELLFSLDGTRLRSEYDLALQQLETARQNLSKTERETFSDPSKRTEINVLRETIKAKQLEANYAQERLNLTDVRAERDGIALFSDVNDLLGKPVSAGDKIMMLANPDEIELLIKLPSESMIDINNDVPVKFFLNTEPLKSHKAMIENVSYQPTEDADGILSYKARATIDNEKQVERIGLVGTAKVYGGRTILIINILRRPFIALRNLIGL